MWYMLFLTSLGSSSYTFQLRTFHPNKTVSKKESRFLYYIQAKCGDIVDKNPNAVDDNE